MKQYKFWMVFAEGGQSPRKQHYEKGEAEEEAQRLARLNGRPAYVLESVCGYEIPEPVVNRFLTDGAAPQEERNE